MKKPPLITVAVVTFNSSEMLPGLLDSLAVGMAGVTPYEVIIVDNASTDGAVPMLEKEFPQVRLIKNEKRHGGEHEVRCHGIDLLDELVDHRGAESPVAEAERHADHGEGNGKADEEGKEQRRKHQQGGSTKHLVSLRRTIALVAGALACEK